MNETAVPKWQRELKSFVGIKSGIILEGNVYDEFPYFSYDGETPVFEDVDNLDCTLTSLFDPAATEVFFFDPVDGFYCYDDAVEEQKKRLEKLLCGYTAKETLRKNGNLACLMPTAKQKESRRSGAEETEQYIWVSEIIRDAMSNKEKITDKESLIFVMNFASRLDACNLREAEANTMFLNLMAATTALQTGSAAGNTLILVVDKYNDIPAWVYLNNPNIRTISLCAPDRGTRRLYLQNLHGKLADYQVLGDEDADAGKQFVAETEGLKLQEVRQVLQLAHRMCIPPEKMHLAFRLYKYGVSDDPWENLENDILTDIETNLEKRVKGQPEALKKVKTVVTRAVKGLSGLQHSGASHKPKGILFFAGPTGTGKTETAKALAESIFGDENACIRFDMSEYRLEHSDQKLFGAPPGYVGYEGGGQLTNAVKNRPFSVLLFDEIEKASPTILDKFLQILEDGRMTDNQGNIVYFGETIIIFTSNIGLTKEDTSLESRLSENRRRVATIEIEDVAKEDTDTFRQQVTETLTEEVKAYFRNIGRPELLNRLGEDNIVVFQFINVNDAKTICDYKLQKICDNIFAEKHIRINTDRVKDFFREKAVLERANGGRGVGNMLEREFLNPLGRALCDFDQLPQALSCYEENGIVQFEVTADDN